MRSQYEEVSVFMINFETKVRIIMKVEDSKVHFFDNRNDRLTLVLVLDIMTTGSHEILNLPFSNFFR